MKKLLMVLALGILLIPGIVMAQPPGCSWEGDPIWYYGWGALDRPVYHQPGWDYTDIWAGASVTYDLAWGNYGWTTTCTAIDTFCWHALSFQGWDILGEVVEGDPPMGSPTVMDFGYLGEVWVTITAPCSAEICDYDTVIVWVEYANNAGACDATCGDCTNPDYRASRNWNYWAADTLVLHVVEAPPALYITQDTFTEVDRGQEQAYLAFQLCNGDPCAPETEINYNITSKGHVGGAINTTSSIMVSGGTCGTVYGIIDASLAVECDLDTLMIIAWVGTTYDTCVQVIHVVEPKPVPLFTVPVVTILVLALILAAAVFMRRRAVSRA